jgi:arylsulfatase A-like enzyme
VVVVTVDTLRTERLSTYGYSYLTSPNLDKLADEGVLFESVTAQIPVTGPNHCTIFTGLYPQTHGSYRNGIKMNEGAVPLAEMLKEAGFRTAAFVSSWTLKDRLTGLDRGFDHYDQDFTDRYRMVNSQRFANEVTDRAIGWLDEQNGEPFFLWVHYFDPHTPYRLVRGFEELGPARGVEAEALPRRKKEAVRYDSEIAFTDAQMGRLIGQLRQRGWLEETLLVYTADHGEAFGEHGYKGHGRRVHEPGVRVPLVIRFPARLARGRRVLQTAASVDVTSTILDLLALPIPHMLQGQSLLPWMEMSPPPPPRERDIYAVAYPGAVGHLPGIRWLFNRKKPDFPIWMAVRRGSMKYVLHPRKGKARLYDLATDPGEMRDVAAEHREYDSFRVRLAEWFQRTRGKEGATALTREDQERLRSLGYVGTPRASAASVEQPGKSGGERSEKESASGEISAR